MNERCAIHGDDDPECSVRVTRTPLSPQFKADVAEGFETGRLQRAVYIGSGIQLPDYVATAAVKHFNAVVKDRDAKLIKRWRDGAKDPIIADEHDIRLALLSCALDLEQMKDGQK